MSHSTTDRTSLEDARKPPDMAEGDKPTRIDEIDQQLLHLLAERGDLTFQLAETETRTEQEACQPKLDYGRLQRLDDYWSRNIDSKFPQLGVRQVLKEIFGICSSIARPRRIAYLGPPGTFSHGALLQEFGASPIAVECSTIAGVFSAVERCDADYGVVPIENSIEGSVTHTHDCFLRSRLLICGEFVFEVRLCLAAKELEFDKIERVYSHPQPLAQCRIWLSTHLPRAQTISCSSTTVAAQEAANYPRAAAVTSSLGAELNGLQILTQGIEDVAGNATRFVIIATNDAPPTGRDKTSVVFSTPDERGALLRVLSIFDSENLNLTRIESRPDKSRRWEYVFFTDIEGHRTDAALIRATNRIQTQCQMVQILGSYPKALASRDTLP